MTTALTNPGRVELRLQPQQAKAFTVPANEILYGGAAGGGKQVLCKERIAGWERKGDGLGAMIKQADAWKIGEYLVGADGQPTQIMATSEVEFKDFYRLTFDDGETLEVSGDHNWQVLDTATRGGHKERGRNWMVRTTLEIMASGLAFRDQRRWAIPLMSGPMDGPDKEKPPLEPYTLGYWLGNGCKQGSTMTCHLDDSGAILSQLREANPSVTFKPKVYDTETKRAKILMSGWIQQIGAVGWPEQKGLKFRTFDKAAGVSGLRWNRWSAADRLSLLQGMLDSDGFVDPRRGAVEFTSVDKEFTFLVRGLMQSLGAKPTMPKSYPASGKGVQDLWRMTCSPTAATHLHFMRLPRKQELLSLATRPRSYRRYIEKIEPVGKAWGICFHVAAADHLFVMTENGFIVTHNSHLMRVDAIYWCQRVPGLQAYIFRRNYGDLRLNHMEGPTSFRELLAPLVNAGKCTIVEEEIRFDNGAKIHLCHLQYTKSLQKYQGAEIHLLCCEKGERVRMADGNAKMVADLTPGDWVMTLKGARKVLTVGKPRPEKSFKCKVWDSFGNRQPDQTHGVTHSILTDHGWISAYDIVNEPPLPWTYEPKGSRSFRKSSSLTSKKFQFQKRFPDSRNDHQRPIPECEKLPLGNQSGRASDGDAVPIQPETPCGLFQDEPRAAEQRPSIHRLRVVLASQWLNRGRETQEQAAASPGELPDAPIESRPGDFPDDCRHGFHYGDGHPPMGVETDLESVPRQGDAGARTPWGWPLDGEDKAHSGIVPARRYAHPYTGSKENAEIPTELGFAEISSCGEKEVVDIGIADANHYVTENGLVNKNCIDELTHFEEKQYRYLRGRVRLGSLVVPDALRHRLPRIVCGTNPGGVGHNWVKRCFIKLGAMRVVKMPKKEGAMRRVFIPARLEDNPAMIANDPDYESRLEGLGDAMLVRAMREGDWDVVAGAMFGDKWRKTRHTCDAFPIPVDWKVWRGADDGYGAPAACYWLAENPATGTIFVADELYRADMLPDDYAARVLAKDYALEREQNGDVVLNTEALDGLMDSAAFSNNGQSDTPRGKQIVKAGAKFRPVDKWPGSRVHRCQDFHRRLATNPRDPDGRPGIIFFSRCRMAIETIPSLPRDPNNLEDVDTSAVDHCFIAGTMIQTPAGERPIEAIAAGDLVCTRLGPYPVAANWIHPDQPVTTQRGLTGTPHHPVWTETGYKRLDSLTEWDTVTTWRKWKALSSKASFIGDILIHPNEKTGFIIALAEAVAKPCTGPFTDIISERFQQECTSITRTETLSTMIRRTLNALRRQSIPQSTSKKGGRNYWKTLGKRRRQLLNGIAAKLAGNGILITQSGQQQPWQRKRILADSVAFNIAGNHLGKAIIAPRPAQPKPGGKAERMTLPALANYAELPSPPTDSTNPQLVVDRAGPSSGTSQRADVFNLTVDGPGEFFANGVLCLQSYDAVTYGLQWKQAGVTRRRLGGV